MNALRKLSLAIAFILFGGMAQAEELRLGTAGLGGAFYPLGQAIANLVNAHAGDEISMVPIVTGGSVANPTLLANGELEIAITNNNLARLAVAGAGPYSSLGPVDISAVGSLHPSVLHMIVLADSDIRTFEDLRGRRVAVGPTGGGTLGFLNSLLPLHGMTMDDIVPSFVSYADGFSQLTDGTVDASLALTGFPASAVAQAAATAELRFIKFSEGKLEEAASAVPAYGRFEIPADEYDTNEPGIQIGVSNVLVVQNGIDEATVRAIAAAIYDHMDEFIAENAIAAQINPARSTQLSVPLHPGAKAYFDAR